MRLIIDESGSLYLSPALGEPPVTQELLPELLARLSVAYKINYTDRNSLHYQSAKDLLRRAIEKGYTLKEFLSTLDRMTEECPFPTWTPADFFKKERAKLYSRSWYEENLLKNSSLQHRIEIYDVNGEERYYIKTGKRLPFPMIYPVNEIIKPKPHEDETVTPPTREQFDLAKEYFRLKKENDLIRNENQKLRKLIEEYEKDLF